MSGDVVERSQSFEFKGKTYYRWPIMNGPSGSSTRISDKPFPAVCPCCGRDSTSQAAEIDALKHDIARYVEANTALMAERTSLIETKREQIGALTNDLTQARKMFDDCVDQHNAQMARAETAERLLAEARAALEPFAEAAGSTDANDDYSSAAIWEHPSAWDITIGDLRRAARTLTHGGENGR